MPAFLMRFIVGFLRSLDNVGKLPRAIQSASPLSLQHVPDHNLGSLGIGPIYHHLYEFGTVSVFAAWAIKTRVHTVTETGEREVKALHRP
jgi:hypothetical protein